MGSVYADPSGAYRLLDAPDGIPEGSTLLLLLIGTSDVNWDYVNREFFLHWILC